MPRVFCIIVALVLAGCCKKEGSPQGEYIGAEPAKTSASNAVAPAQPAAATPPAPTPSGSASASADVRLRAPDVAAIDEKATLADALAYAKPKIEDATDDWDRGTYLLGEWLSSHGSWATVAALPETSSPKISKDAEGETGKRFCMTGTVTTIKAFRGSDAKMFWGIMSSSETQVMVFLAAGDTGNIVDNSTARFCGVSTGIYNLTLKSGAPFPSPKAVGFFDLPKNKKR